MAVAANDPIQVAEIQRLQMQAMVNAQEQHIQHRRPPRPPQQRDPQRDARHQRRKQMKAFLRSMGFEKRNIHKAIRRYEKTYGADQFNPDDLTRIMLNVQEKDEMKRQLMAMDPKMAEEVFGGKLSHHPLQQNDDSAKLKMEQSRGFGVGSVVLYRQEIECQILAEMDEYVQISWPIDKAVYQRAVIWCKTESVEKRKKIKSDLKSESNSKSKQKKKTWSFGGKQQIDESGSRKKHRFQFERIWSRMMVDEFTTNKDGDGTESKQNEIAMKIVSEHDDDDDDDQKEIGSQSKLHCKFELMSIG